MYIYDDEDNEGMNSSDLIEYTGIINDKVFRGTGFCIVERMKNDEGKSAQENLALYGRTS